MRAVGSNAGDVAIAVDGCAKDARLLPEQSVELPFAEIGQYSLHAQSDGDGVVVTYTRPMGDK